MSEGLWIWTICSNATKDFPGFFVVRPWLVDASGMRPYWTGCLCASLAEARSTIPLGLYRMPRQYGDDPVIVETWM